MTETSTRAADADPGAPGPDPAAAAAARRADTPGSAIAAADRALRIVALVWIAAWLALMATSGGVSESLAPTLSWAMLAALGVGWCVLVLARLPVTGVTVVALAVTALVQAALAPPAEVWSQTTVVITWTNLATLTCGLVVRGARGRIGIVAIAAGQLVVLSTASIAEGSFGVAWRGILAAAAYALADGMAAHVAGSAVRAQADDTDAAAEQLAVERGLHAGREAETREVERVARVLHDTVLNTLGAVRRGVAPGEVDALRARCAQDFAALRDTRDRRFDATGAAGVYPARIVRSLASRAEVLSLELDLDARITSAEPLPTEVGDAVHGACSEALNNVAQHSGVRAARLTMTWDGERLAVSVHDDGRGWSGETDPSHGVARSILGRADDAGVEAHVDTGPERGTTVSMAWWSPDGPSSPGRGTADETAAAPVAPADDPEVAGVLARVAVGAGAWVTGLLVLQTLLFWSGAGSLTSVAAVVVLGVVLRIGWVVGVRRRHVPLPALTAAVLVLAAFLVTALPARSATTCEALTSGWWGPDGAVVVMLALVLLTRGWWWTTAGSVAMVLGAMSLDVRAVPLPADCAGYPAVNAALELTVVLAMVIFREALLRQWARASAARALADDLRIAVDVREATARARDARLDIAIADAVPLLDTISLGLADPADPAVRRQCGNAESALRALLVLGPAHDWLRAALADAVLAAYAGGGALVVMPGVGEVPLPPDEAAAPMRRLLEEATPRGETLTVAVARIADGGSLTMVADGALDALSPETVRELATCCGVDRSRMGEQTLVEVTWR